jgi:hypothetical protein
MNQLLSSEDKKLRPGDTFDIAQAFVHLARLALEGRQPDLAALIRQSLHRLEPTRSDLGGAIRAALELTQPRPVRRNARPVPADAESRLELIRTEPTCQRRSDFGSAGRSDIASVLNA